MVLQINTFLENDKLPHHFLVNHPFIKKSLLLVFKHSILIIKSLFYCNMNESKEDYHDTDFNIGENTQDYMLNYMTQRSPNGSPNDSEEEPTQVLLDPSQNTMFQLSQQGGLRPLRQ